MPRYVAEPGGGWKLANEMGPLGPTFAFDSDLGKPIWRLPDGGGWVDAAGNVVSGITNGQANFAIPLSEGLLAVI